MEEPPDLLAGMLRHLDLERLLGQRIDELHTVLDGACRCSRASQRQRHDQAGYDDSTLKHFDLLRWLALGAPLHTARDANRTEVWRGGSSVP